MCKRGSSGYHSLSKLGRGQWGGRRCHQVYRRGSEPAEGVRMTVSVMSRTGGGNMKPSGPGCAGKEGSSLIDHCIPPLQAQPLAHKHAS